MPTFVLHDETVNTFGYRMLTSGANLEEFRKNPVMLLNHNDWSLPIGRWENIRIEESRILADAVFDDTDPVGRQVKEKVDKNFIRAASVGAWPPEEISEDQTLRLSGQSGPTVTRWTVREASIVSIPANHNAVVFYDRETGKLIDNSEVLKLFDIQNNELSKVKSNMFEKIAKLLNLADNASEADVTAALRILLSDRDRLKTENLTLISRVDDLNKAEKQKKASEAVTLVDAAVKSGRIDYKAKESYLKLFDVDFEAAKTTLESIPERQSIAGRMADASVQNVTEMADLQKATWDELDKAGKLVVLKDKYPDLYEQKFEQRFGVKPKK